MRSSGDVVRMKAGSVLLIVFLMALAGCGESSQGGEMSAEAIANYPERPLTIVAWVTPGSPTDLLARAIARVGSRHFGQRIDVVNRPGGSGSVAMNYLLSRPADGHTLGIMTSSGVITMAAGHIPFEPEQFNFIQRIQLDPLLMAVPANSPHQNLDDFFGYARENPGELSVAGYGATSIHFLANNWLKEEAGNPEMSWIAYEGSSDAAVAVLGGHADATDNNYSVIREHLRAGTLRVLGVSAPMEALPDVPTYQEQGYDVASVHWRGIMAPAGIPDELATKIHGLLQQTVEDPEFAEFMAGSGNEYGLMESPEAVQDWVLQEVRDSRAALQELGLVQGAGGQ